MDMVSTIYDIHDFYDKSNQTFMSIEESKYLDSPLLSHVEGFCQYLRSLLGTVEHIGSDIRLPKLHGARSSIPSLIGGTSNTPSLEASRRHTAQPLSRSINLISKMALSQMENIKVALQSIRKNHLSTVSHGL